MRVTPAIRTLASYFPSQALLGARRLRDFAVVGSGHPHEVDFEAFRSYAVERPVVVDVGANRGQSIRSFSRVLVDPQIWAFEPNQKLADYLVKRFESKDTTIYCSGLGSAAETLRLFVPRYGNTVWDTRASLSADSARSALSERDFWRFQESRIGLLVLDVDIRTLDEFALSPNIVKIDVEGTEDAVVEGGAETIRQSKPVILAEGSLSRSGPLLASMGYLPHRFDEDRRAFIKGAVGNQNTFYLCESHYPMFDLAIS